MANRNELLANAVAFLSDPQTQHASLAQRVQFLQAKGLTPDEIDQAIATAAPSASTSVPSTPSHPAVAYQPHVFYPAQPPPNDWRDYFIFSIVSGALVYGAVSLARRFLLPHLQPPSQSQYEADTAALDAQFESIERQLKLIHADCQAAREATEQQRHRVDGLAGDLDQLLQQVKDTDQKARDDLREIRQEVDVIRGMIPTMLEKNKENANAALLELQQEVRSLKTLLSGSGSRGPASTLPTPTLTGIGGRPTIPSWQLSLPISSAASESKKNGETKETTAPTA